MTDETSCLLDLAAEALGGRALFANDEFFAAKENLLRAEPPVFRPDEYTDRGKWMDGWETRRRREPGHDWCVLRLGLAGMIREVVVDTTHFRGNAPEACSVEAAAMEADPGPDAPDDPEGWSQIVARTALSPHSPENRFPVSDPRRFTHLRLNIFPDGGVARLRVHGEVRPDWSALIVQDQAVDLAAIPHGGRPLASSDEFFGSSLNLLMPDPPVDMRDGWETRRRRGPGHDWVIIGLGHRGRVVFVEVDTTHFKGNYPESCSLEACDAADGDWQEAEWRELLPRSPLEPDRAHVFGAEELRPGETATHIRFRIYPDGGVSRLRVFGHPVDGSG